MRSKRDPRRKSDAAPAGAEAGARPAFVVHGWTILLSPGLLDQLEKLLSAAAAERSKRLAGEPAGFHMKVAASIRHLILHEIPEDPSRSKYRQGGTLGHHRKHWLRAKFANGRFRLFFRYHSKARLIVFAWVNDAETLRTYGSRTDAYVVFRRMLESDDPPDDWDALVRAASGPDATRRAGKLLGTPPASDPQA